MRPVLIGECPGLVGRHEPLDGRPATILCQEAGIPPEPSWYAALAARFEPRNLYRRHVARWSAARARAQARRNPLPDDRPTVLLGRRVACAYGLPQVDYYDWVGYAPETLGVDEISPAPPLVAVIQHPSGLNRALNDPSEWQKCGNVLRQALAMT